jgi:hypothetical protein
MYCEKVGSSTEFSESEMIQEFPTAWESHLSFNLFDFCYLKQLTLQLLIQSLLEFLIFIEQGKVKKVRRKCFQSNIRKLSISSFHPL